MIKVKKEIFCLVMVSKLISSIEDSWLPLMTYLIIKELCHKLKLIHFTMWIQLKQLRNSIDRHFLRKTIKTEFLNMVQKLFLDNRN